MGRPESYDYPMSYIFRCGLAALDGEYLPPLEPVEDERMVTLQARVESLERELAGKRIVYRGLKTVTPTIKSSRKSIEI